ncbi:Transposase [compost metagenome]
MLKGHLNAFLLGNHLKLLSTKRYRRGVLWEVEKLRTKTPCLRCGSDQTVRAGKVTTTVREESLRGVSLWLRVHKHRIYCKSCKKTFAEPVAGIWPRRRSTQRFRKSVAQACGKMTDLSTVSRFYNVSHGFAYKVYYEQIEVKMREHITRNQWPEVLGIDEHFFRRKNGVTQFVTMFTNVGEKRMFEIAHGKENKNIIEQVKDIPGRESVKTVVIDMSSSYKSLARKMFPNAKLVADKFHVLRLITPSIMKAGKDIHGHRQHLKVRRKLLRSRVKLDYFVRCEIDEYLKSHDKLNELYRWKEKIYEFYRIKGYGRAVSAFNKLTEAMSKSGLEEIQKLLKTFKRWRQEILLYFADGYTNAFTERMNGTGKLVQRRAFGYKSFRNYRLRVLSACLFKTF